MKIRRIYTGFFATVLLAGLSGIGCGRDSSTGPSYETRVDVTVVVLDTGGQPVSNALVSISPNATTTYTDENGLAVLENRQTGEYRINVSHLRYDSWSVEIEVAEEETEPLVINLQNAAPLIEITAPRTRIYQELFIGDTDVVFQAKLNQSWGLDYPDSCFVWESNIDGILGTGREITVDTMTHGTHRITVTCGKENSATGTAQTTLRVVENFHNSYFPVVYGAEWVYQHPEPSFYMYNSKDREELWELNDIEVEITGDLERITTMHYKSTGYRDITFYTYTVTDELSLDGDDLYILSTSEHLELRYENDVGYPDNELFIETVYSPRYLMLKNINDPAAEPSYEHEVHVDVVWTYEEESSTETFEESFSVATSYSVGDRTLIEGYANDYEAYPVHIHQSQSERTWWLARGVGMVQLAYNTFEFPKNAVLRKTNLHPANGHTTGKSVVVSAPARVDGTIEAHPGFERIRGIRSVLQDRLPYPTPVR